MVATRVGGVRRVVCGSPSYFSAHGIPRTPADLADLTCVTFANLAAGTSWSFASRSKDLAQAPRPRCRLTVNAAEAAIDAAIAGIRAVAGLSGSRVNIPVRGNIVDSSQGCVAHKLGRTRRRMLRPRPKHLPSDTYLIVVGSPAVRRKLAGSLPIQQQEELRDARSHGWRGAHVVRLCGM